MFIMEEQIQEETESLLVGKLTIIISLKMPILIKNLRIYKNFFICYDLCENINTNKCSVLSISFVLLFLIY